MKGLGPNAVPLVWPLGVKLGIFHVNQTSMCFDPHQNMFKPFSVSLMAAPNRHFFCGSYLLFMFHVCLCCSLQPCDHLLGKGRPLGSLVYCVFLCFLVTFPYGVQGQVWYLIVLFPDLCLALSFFTSKLN